MCTSRAANYKCLCRPGFSSAAGNGANCEPYCVIKYNFVLVDVHGVGDKCASRLDTRLCDPPGYVFAPASTYTDLLPVGVKFAHVASASILMLINFKMEADATCAYYSGAAALINGRQVGGFVGGTACYCQDCATKSWQSSDPGFLSSYVIGGTNQVSLTQAYVVSTRVTVKYQVAEGSACVASPATGCPAGQYYSSITNKCTRE